MKITVPHDWDLTPSEAIQMQAQLRQQVILEDRLPPSIQHVAGIDVGFEENNTVTLAGVAVLGFPDLQLREYRVARQPTRFPYIPGLLSFREIPTILDALAQLTIEPDLLLVDGQGIAHPRRCGIATHLGILCDKPSIGVGKSRLIGTHAEVPDVKGAWVPLIHKKEVIGAVLRTRPGVKPLYISPGHRISVETAVDYVMRCTTKYRLPETTRWAHRLASGTEAEIARALAKEPQLR